LEEELGAVELREDLSANLDLDGAVGHCLVEEAGGLHQIQIYLYKLVQAKIIPLRLIK
jgi:hypothetical protein